MIKVETERVLSDSELFELAYSYEQVSSHRMAPNGFGPVTGSIDDWSSELIEAWNEEQLQDMTVEETGLCE